MVESSKFNLIFQDLLSKILTLTTPDGLFPHKVATILEGFLRHYVKALKQKGAEDPTHLAVFSTYIDLVQDQLHHPFNFSPYHQKIKKPVNFHSFCIDFFKPLVDMKHSTIQGLDHLKEINEHVKAGHNVILLANHQIEADPQAIFILLESLYHDLADKMIFVAGERVVTDPLAVPFSKGCNLLCIYSKRYIDTPLELKEQKLVHNQKTMQLMSDLLSEGGKCIYVAPSGGRDRPNEHGHLVPALFDAQSIEMFYLMSKKSKTPTFFYPLTLSTHCILPPPQTIQIELGESREPGQGPIHLAFGHVLDMQHYPGSDLTDKSLRRKARADYIHNLVCQDYKKFI